MSTRYVTLRRRTAHPGLVTVYAAKAVPSPRAADPYQEVCVGWELDGRFHAEWEHVERAMSVRGSGP